MHMEEACTDGSWAGGKSGREKHKGTTSAALVWVPCVGWRWGMASIWSWVQPWGAQIVQIELMPQFDPARIRKQLRTRAFESHKSALDPHKSVTLARSPSFPLL